MSSIWVTGDCHCSYEKFANKMFPIQKQMTHDDYIIVCGDFGIWDGDRTENYNLDELSRRNFTTLFVDGNHSNFDRLCTEEYRKYMRGEDITGADQGEFPLVDMFGGKVQKIRDNIYHLLRGEVYEILGKKFFAFGGAASHDIQDGILDRADFKSDEEFFDAAYHWRKSKRMYRIAHVSWWKEELPNEDEMRHGMESLAKHDFKVDYILSHCAPTSVHLAMGFDKPDICTDYLQQVVEHTDFQRWYFGHYHKDLYVNPQFMLTYRSIYPVYDAELERSSAFGKIDRTDTDTTNSEITDDER